MKCPKCEYTDELSEDDIRVQNDQGEFFKSPIKLERNIHGWDWLESEARIYGCPKCTELFFIRIE